MAKSQNPKPARMSRGKVWTFSIISGLAVVALSAASIVGPPLVNGIDPVGENASARISQKVSQTLLTSYCPSQVSLNDQESYGDSEFSVSQGDLSSAKRFAAIGSVYSSSLNSLSSEKVSDAVEGDDSFALGGLKAEEPTVLSSTLLSAEKGTGSTGTVASWASSGDVQGLAATRCTGSALTSSFVVPSTTTGNTSTLVVANTSDKPTSVSVELWGASSQGSIAASTDSTLTVAAHSEKTLNLSAAAADQEGLFVMLTSKVVPVYSVVKVTSASGLTSKGVEYAGASSKISGTTSLTGVHEGQKMTVRAFSQKSQTVQVTWTGENDEKEAKEIVVEAGKLASVDLGSVPQGMNALRVESAEGLYVSATALNDAEGQQDFSVLSPNAAVASSAVTIPDGTNASLTIANEGNKKQEVSFQGIDSSGKIVGTKKRSISGMRSVSVPLDDIGSSVVTVVLTVPDDSHIVWSASLGVKALTDAKVSAAAVVEPTSLMPQTSVVTSTRSPLVSAR